MLAVSRDVTLPLKLAMAKHGGGRNWDSYNLGYTGTPLSRFTLIMRLLFVKGESHNSSRSCQ